MEMLGNINIEELETLKRKLAGCGYPITNDALDMIKKLENTIVTMTLNHNHYVNWVVEQMQCLEKRNSDLSWAVHPDTSGGAFTQDEIDRSRNGGW